MLASRVYLYSLKHITKTAIYEIQNSLCPIFKYSYLKYFQTIVKNASSINFCVQLLNHFEKRYIKLEYRVFRTRLLSAQLHMHRIFA